MLCCISLWEGLPDFLEPINSVSAICKTLQSCMVSASKGRAMFPIGELQWMLKYLIGFGCIYLVVHFRKISVSSNNIVRLPKFRRNSILLWIEWIIYSFRKSNVSENPILRLIFYVSKRYRNSGIFHIHLPFFHTVLLFRPDTVQPLLQSTSNINKPIFYDFLEDWVGSSLLLRKGDQWHKRRKLLTPAFHLRILETYISIIEEKSKILVNKLINHERSDAINIIPLINHTFLDILCETAMGLHARNSVYDYSTHIKHLNILLSVIQDRINAIWMWPDIIFRLTRKNRELKENLECLNKLTYQIIEERFSLMANKDQNKTCTEQHQSRNRLAFLDIILNSVSNDPDFTLEDVRREVQLFLFAGLETSALTTTWMLHLLGKHLDIQKRLREEIGAVLGENTDIPLSKKDLYDLKYTECVIKETMRLYPVVPFIARRVNKEFSIGEYTIPEGFTCVVNIYDLHRNPDSFPNPELFDPERFFPENTIGRHPYAYIPFSAGQRNCIGQKFAMMEMKILLARIIQSMTFESIDQSVYTEVNITLHPKSPIRIKIKKT